jgi:mannose-6-phosphate isomerase-like protein (cupin superfamily)
MAMAGEKIYNPIQGDSLEFRQTAQDTGGELMSAEMVVSPRGGNSLHVHPLQEEHFVALSGTLSVQRRRSSPARPTGGGTNRTKKKPASWSNCGRH